MSEIKYICMSDLHLGDKYSLLTYLIKDEENEKDKDKKKTVLPSATLKALAECLKTLAAQQKIKPTLVLVGDALELALASTHEALMAFELFVKEMLIKENEPLFDKIIFIPGNHDHHLWEATRETRYAENPPYDDDGLLLPFKHTSLMLCKSEKENNPDNLCADFFLSHLLKNGRIKGLTNKISIVTAYPNFALEKNNRCIIMTHGHYIEPLYCAMSELDQRLFPKRIKPKSIEDLERQNFAWIDFFWSSMGRQGEVGEDVERIYYSLNNPKELRKMLVNLAESCIPDETGFIGNILSSYLSDKAIEWLIKIIVERERCSHDGYLSNEAADGLYEYMNKYVTQQYMQEAGIVAKGVIDLETTLIFGHTHSPFCLSAPSLEDPLTEKFNGFSKPLDIYNTGGWVVEDEDPNETHGASLVVIDEDLNTAAIEMYMEKADGLQSPMQIICADGHSNELAAHCEKLIEKDSFKKFSEALAAEALELMKSRESFAEKIKAEK